MFCSTGTYLPAEIFNNLYRQCLITKNVILHHVEATDLAVAFATRDSRGVGECVLGHSTSMLLQMLGTTFESVVTKDDEIIAMDRAHESNFGPWERLAKATGATLMTWKPEPANVCVA